MRDQFFFTVGPISGKYCMHTQRQYCAYTQDSDSLRLAYKLIEQHNLKFEAHINRTRFWVDADSELNTICALRFKCIDSETDHALGL